MRQVSCDVAVIGAGVGGLCAGALLAHSGYKVLLVEKLALLGGRCSTIEYKGFKLGTGVVYTPTGEGLAHVFREVNAPWPLRTVPPEDARYRIEGKVYQPPPKGVLGWLMSRVNEAKGEQVIAAIRRAMKWQEPPDTITARDWLLQYTRDERVLGIFQSLTAAMQTINLHEQPAGSFVRFLKWSAQARGFGHPPGGFLDLMQSLASVIKARGGDVWTGCPARKVLVTGRTVKGIVVNRGGEEVAVEARVVISNAGPGPTVELAGKENFDKAYLVQLQESIRPIPLVWISISSDRPLMDGAGPFFVTGARRVNALYSPTAICPEVAPAGKHLVQSGGAPLSSSAPFNAKEEIALNLQDLREVLPGLDRHGEVLLAQTFSGNWPACRTWPGYELPLKTPVENLYNVGDGVCPTGMSGSAGCAESARLVVADIKKRFPLSSPSMGISANLRQ